VEGCHQINKTSVSQNMVLLVFALCITENLCADVFERNVQPPPEFLDLLRVEGTERCNYDDGVGRA
jgi:hypothetical protein